MTDFSTFKWGAVFRVRVTMSGICSITLVGQGGRSN